MPVREPPDRIWQLIIDSAFAAFFCGFAALVAHVLGYRLVEEVLGGCFFFAVFLCYVAGAAKTGYALEPPSEQPQRGMRMRPQPQPQYASFEEELAIAEQKARAEDDQETLLKIGRVRHALSELDSKGLWPIDRSRSG
jgi:hypothetical protein